jgi:hypothetical protein
MFWPPMAAFTTMPPSWYVHHLIPVSYANIGLKFQPRRKNINLDNKARFSYPQVWDLCGGGAG